MEYSLVSSKIIGELYLICSTFIEVYGALGKSGNLINKYFLSLNKFIVK